MAPISPFMADHIHRNLTGSSVHLDDWPRVMGADLALEQRMALVRELAEAGRRIRVEADRRQRLPCQAGWIVGGPDLSEFHSILAEELNVEDLQVEVDLERFQRIELAPNRRALGAKCRQDLPRVLELLSEVDPDAFLLEIEAEISYLEGYLIGIDDIEIRRVERDGYSARTLTEGDVSLVLDLATTETVLSKGLARDIIRRIQQKRKDLDLEVEASITLSVWLAADCPDLADIDWQHIQTEVRAAAAELKLASDDTPRAGAESFVVDGATVYFTID
jgi:isoleucyl-tRNA synthetase